MEVSYYKVSVYLKTDYHPLSGIKEFPVDNSPAEIYESIMNQLARKYSKEDILKVDCWPLAKWNTELVEYLAKKDAGKGNHTD